MSDQKEEITGSASTNAVSESMKELSAWLEDDMKSFDDEIAVIQKKRIPIDITASEEREHAAIANKKYAACLDCGKTCVSNAFAEAFDINLCSTCRRKDEEKYELIPKSKAKSEYLLTDTQLEELSFMSKKNPTKPSWAPMKLYLKSQIVQLAISTFQSLDNIAEEKKRRGVKTLEQAIARKKKKTAAENEGMFLSVQSSKSKNKKRKTKAKKIEIPTAATQVHVHTMIDDTVRSVEKCTTCGFEVPYESF